MQQQVMEQMDIRKKNEERLRRARLVEQRAAEDRKLDEEAKKAKSPTPQQASAPAPKPAAGPQSTQQQQPNNPPQQKS